MPSRAQHRQVDTGLPLKGTSTQDTTALCRHTWPERAQSPCRLLSPTPYPTQLTPPPAQPGACSFLRSQLSLTASRPILTIGLCSPRLLRQLVSQGAHSAGLPSLDALGCPRAK
jgi:hypothetical protein